MRTLVCNVEQSARPLTVGAAEQLLRSRAGPSARRTAQLTDSAEGLQVTRAAQIGQGLCFNYRVLTISMCPGVV